MPGDFAAALESRISTALSGGDSAGTSSAPASDSPPAPASAPASSPSSAPASVPATGAETAPAAAPEIHIPDDDEFAFPDEQDDKTPASAQPADAAEPQPADKEMDLTDIANMPPKEVISKFLQDPRGRRMYQSFQKDQLLTRPPEEGGIGYAPTIDQIKEMHEDHRDLRLMVHEFDNSHSNPQYAENWVKNWFGRFDQNGKPAPGAIQMAQGLMRALDQLSPDLYRAAARFPVFAYVEERYRNVPNYGTEDERLRALNIAVAIESDLTGESAQQIVQRRGITESVWKGTAPAGAPNDPRAAQVERGLQQIQQFNQQRQWEANNAFTTSLNDEIKTGLLGLVQYALKPLADAYQGKDGKPARTYTALEKSFHDEVVSRVGSSDRNPALRDFVIARDRALASRNPDDIKEAARAWTAVARPIIRQLRSEYLSDARERIASESQKRLDTLDEASQKRGGSSVVQPAEKNNPNGKAQRLPGESFNDYMERVTRAALAV